MGRVPEVNRQPTGPKKNVARKRFVSGSYAAPPAQQTSRQKDGCLQKFQHSADSDAHNAKWQQYQPNQGIQQKSKQCQRPANDEQWTPQQERVNFVLLLVKARQDGSRPQ